MLLRIGELARAVGLSPDTLRHYERLGLLAHVGRTAGGFRQYPPQALRRVRTIQAALEIGFSLQDLAGLFRARAAGRPPCREARRLAGTKLAELNQELARLAALRAELERVIERWDDQLARSKPGTPALLLETLADARSTSHATFGQSSNSRHSNDKSEKQACDSSNASKNARSFLRSQRSAQAAARTKKSRTLAVRTPRTPSR
ncbi:MAG TPA: heavy metal-responsive transcriptional regulator [Polyangiaceae bacterium]|nr:heavy metal-responsive transcriptional regulator [Polyangiaceae bacterium]